MSKDRQRRRAAKKEAAVRGDRRVGSDCPVIVVGIGAPAGRVKSLKQLFAKMPPGHGVAFVLIQHLEPSRRNLTVKLVKEQMALAVVEATDGMPVLADRIHVIPPDKFLNITGSRLTLQKAVYCDGLRMPIDHFFCSLAFDQRRRGCGILLSGTGSDGNLGLSEIKAAGGRTFVEDPGSAELPGMRQSAIDAAMVDAVLPVEAMAKAIEALAEQMRAETQSEPAESPEFDANLGAILEILRAKVGHDFRCYKPNTLVRRIRRRMTLGRIATFAGYAGFLREHPEEVALLQKDLLIGVTEFFRQPQAWEILEEKVVAPLVEEAQPGSEIRVWIPGCSTGREAYSLAMLFSEQVEKSGKKVNIQIFATDSDVAALATARSGIYSKEEIGENLSPERLKRFFARKDGLYQVIKTIREQVVFAPQNLTADPPFSRLDLISCRNVLIYLEQQVQKKIITLFHFALREGGFLFLGNAETVGDREDLFVPVSKKWRIYRRIGVGRPVGVEIPVRPTGEPLPAIGKLPAPASTPRMSLASMAQQMMLDRFVPASVMIDRKLQVVYVHGAVEEYLTFPAGELTTRVVDMAREGLRARLRGAIGKCLEINRPVSVTARVRRGDESVPVKTTVSPLRYPREADGLLLITFDDYRVSAAKSQRPGASGQSEVHQLEDELKITREELQSTIEQLEASNDQLKASNEEVTAANEELQSANEEMETSKEELQSLNEELNTINSRLHEKVEELESVNNDVVNLLSSTNIATVFLDKELKVRRYTPASTNLFSLIPSDAGRPIGDVLRRFSDATLLDDARRVLADLSPLSKEVQAEDGRWYIRRITPYRTQDDRIEGVVITFVDVCDLKETEEALRRQHAELEAARTEVENARRRLSVIVDSIADGFFAFDREWRITHVNDAALRHYRKTREEMVGRSLFEVFPPVRGSIFETEYRRAMESGEPVHFEAPSTISDRTMEIHAYPGPDNMTVLFRDVTERNRMVAALRESHERASWLARFPEENPSPVARVSAEGSVLYRNPAAAELPGWACEVGQSLPDPLLPMVGKAMKEEGEVQQDVELGGRSYSVSVSALPGERYANVYGRDTTERKRAEEELKEATRLVQQHAAQLEAIFETMTDPLLFYDAQGRPKRINTAASTLLGIDRNVDGLDDPAIMAIWKSKNYRDLDGRPMLLEEMPFRRALNGETVRGQVLCLTNADGGESILEADAAVLESNSRRDGVVVVWHEITERKRAESVVQARLRMLVAANRLGMSVDEFLQVALNEIEAQTGSTIGFYHFLEADQETLSLQNWSTNTVRNMCTAEGKGSHYPISKAGVWVDCVHERRPVIHNDYASLPHRKGMPPGHAPITREMVVPTFRGDRIVAIIGVGNKPTDYDASDIDIASFLGDFSWEIVERKKAEEALRQRTLELQQLNETLEDRVRERTAELAKSNENLQAETAERLRLVAAVEQAGEGVAIMDREGFIDYVNPAFEGISGLGRPELLGKSYYDLPVKERTDPDIRKKIQDAIRAGEAWSGHVNRRRRDGQSFELDVTFSPIRDQSAKVTNYLAVERDVTREVRLEQHLRQMQKMEAIGTLAGGIAHDFNNLLNPIFINTELVLLDAPLDDRMRQYLQMVLQAAERGRNLVKQIITFSRQKEGERKPTKAEPLIKEVLKFLRSTLPQTVEIRQNIQRETAFILADPTQIHQVIMNLCSNAAYAMRERGGVLEVNLAEVEVDPDMALRYPDFKPGPYLRLTVTDTGAGMTREVMERAFDPFFTTKKPGEGSGMGLSVVHGIVRNHGGAITVYSEAGKGSTFNIFFPRLEAEGSPLDVPLAPLAAGRERILLVDDEEAQVESVRNMLERMGYKVVAKTDSGEALALFRQNPRLFDLVVTDQTMPQMTGVKLAEELLRIRPDLPVILCTGFSETVDAKAAQASGIRHFLMKPFSVREMAETIRRALEKK
jgi:two-component system CheB/CheR fusion protein